VRIGTRKTRRAALRPLALFLALHTCSFTLSLAGGPSEKIRKQFHESWRYYNWRIEMGHSLNDLEYTLVRIKKKYAGAPVNHEMVDRELRAVRALREEVRRKPGVGD
jgi:hypothetical protein